MQGMRSVETQRVQMGLRKISMEAANLSEQLKPEDRGRSFYINNRPEFASIVEQKLNTLEHRELPERYNTSTLFAHTMLDAIKLVRCK